MLAHDPRGANTTPGYVACGPSRPLRDFGDDAGVHGRVFRNGALVRALLSFGARSPPSGPSPSPSAWSPTPTAAPWRSAGRAASAGPGRCCWRRSSRRTPTGCRASASCRVERGPGSRPCCRSVLLLTARACRLRPRRRVHDRLHAVPRQPLGAMPLVVPHSRRADLGQRGPRRAGLGQRDPRCAGGSRAGRRGDVLGSSCSPECAACSPPSWSSACATSGSRPRRPPSAHDEVREGLRAVSATPASGRRRPGRPAGRHPRCVHRLRRRGGHRPARRGSRASGC